MPRCAGRKPDSTPCERIVGASQPYCYAHNPDRAAERSRNASRAGRARPNREIVEIKRDLDDLRAAVRSGKADPKRAAVYAQIVNTTLRAIELERRATETDELVERLRRLEEA